MCALRCAIVPSPGMMQIQRAGEQISLTQSHEYEDGGTGEGIVQDYAGGCMVSAERSF